MNGLQLEIIFADGTIKTYPITAWSGVQLEEKYNKSFFELLGEDEIRLSYLYYLAFLLMQEAGDNVKIFGTKEFYADFKNVKLTQDPNFASTATA